MVIALKMAQKREEYKQTVWCKSEDREKPLDESLKKIYEN